MSKPLEWELVLPDKLPSPVHCCPDAILEYYSKLKSKSARSAELKSNVKRHLLYWEWRIESKPQENCSDKFRYKSPDRKHTYYSLSSLCKAVVESPVGILSLLIQKPESQVSVGTGNIPFVFHDSLTWEPDLLSAIIDSSSLTSLLTAPLDDFPDYWMDIEQSEVQNPSTCPLLNESADLSSSFYGYLKVPQEALQEKTLCPMSQDENLAAAVKIPQEALHEKILFPMSQDDPLATAHLSIFPTLPIKEVPKSTVSESSDGHNAVLEYLRHGSNVVRSQRGEDRIKYLRTKIKSHLECVGWVIKYIEKSGRKELRYVSPDNRKSHISLISACGSYRDNYQHYNFTHQKRLLPHQEHQTAGDSRPMKRCRDPSFSTHSILENTCSLGKPSLVAGAPLTRRSGRNLLARLIDDAEVAVGDEVYYRGKDGQSMAEGLITEEGLVKFLEKGERSIQDACQMLLTPYQAKKIKTVVKEAKRAEKVVKVKKKLAANKFDFGSKSFKCHTCKKHGAVIFCHKCPSKFHIDCINMKEVPNGEWFCKSCEDEPCNEAESCEKSVVDFFTTGNILPRFSVENTKLRLKAKKHLCSIGWSLSHEEGTQRLKYKSPNGKVYFSLMAACQECIFGES